MRKLVVALVLFAPSVSLACGMRAPKMQVVTIADLEAVFDDIDAPAPAQADVVTPAEAVAPAAAPQTTPPAPLAPSTATAPTPRS